MKNRGKEDIFYCILGRKYEFWKGGGGKNINYSDNIHPCLLPLIFALSYQIMIFFPQTTHNPYFCQNEKYTPLLKGSDVKYLWMVYICVWREGVGGQADGLAVVLKGLREPGRGFALVEENIDFCQAQLYLFSNTGSNK